MENNLIAQAALFFWKILADLWELYQLPLRWLSQWLYVDGEVPYIITATYIFFTLAAFSWIYLWIYLPSSWRNRRVHDMKIAIDDGFTPSGANTHDDDLRVQYLKLLHEIRAKQDAMEDELKKMRLHQSE